MTKKYVVTNLKRTLSLATAEQQHCTLMDCHRPQRLTMTSYSQWPNVTMHTRTLEEKEISNHLTWTYYTIPPFTAGPTQKFQSNEWTIYIITVKLRSGLRRYKPFVSPMAKSAPYISKKHHHVKTFWWNIQLIAYTFINPKIIKKQILHMTLSATVHMRLSNWPLLSILEQWPWLLGDY